MLIQMVKEGLLLSTDILTADAELFWQIRMPTITEEQFSERLERAKDHAIGYVVTRIHRGTTVWLVVLEDNQFWRWAICGADYYDEYVKEHEWLTDLSQLFLVGDTTLRHDPQIPYGD